MVDPAGPTVPILDPETGQRREAVIFVAVLGASNYTAAEATGKRDLADWIGSPVRALEFWGGVPDNWKTGVQDPCYYEPDLNPTYRDRADHYGTVILPARVGKPTLADAILERILSNHHSIALPGETLRPLRKVGGETPSSGAPKRREEEAGIPLRWS